MILWAGNLLAKKRPLILLDLARALPEVEFTAVGAPGSDPALLQAFTSQAAGLPNLRYLGHVPPAAIQDLYSRATLLLNTSDAEGFPNTFLEAWAREVPVVTLGSDPDGVIQSLGIGLVLDRTEAPERLRQWLSRPEAIQEAGRAGRAYVLAHHQADHVLDQYEQAFSRLDRSPAPTTRQTGSGAP
jgi:glycosyltransferase involved in cell wall biosynthesis